MAASRANAKSLFFIFLKPPTNFRTVTIPSLPDDYYIKGTLGRQFHEREKSELFLPDLSCAKRAGDRYGLFLWRQQDYFAQFEKEGISLKAWTFGAAYGIICGSIDMSWEGDYGWMRKKTVAGPAVPGALLPLCADPLGLRLVLFLPYSLGGDGG
ncbi:hypothetical protein [Oscillibacter sp.]|uniref:hypothetical protein n=1 Tax=Oscillibacter sp. TaxID=1945593 RepID=UPI002173A817|nr:hypothetical protein [Oscillibacter sp.]MCI9648317.1 hypothetical protein [Oscillibacter sp.]